MSNTKFTPGPWDLTTIGFEMRANDSDCAGTIFGPTDKFGGSPLIADISRSPGDLVADANARLIAAAPEMYELLLRVRGKIAEHISDSDELEEEMEQIIKKITPHESE